MLKTTLKTLGALTLLLILVSSCKKKNDQKSKTELLTQKSWVISKFEVKSGSSAYVDVFPSYDACDKDDKYTFKTNNIFEFDPLIKCDPSETTESGSWAFTDNETKLLFAFGSTTIEQLDDNTLVISQSFGTDAEKVTFRHP